MKRIIFFVITVVMFLLLFSSQPWAEQTKERSLHFPNDTLSEAVNDSEMINREQSSKPNIIILLLDCVRPDHLGCYGYTRATSPCIDALAAQGIKFHNAISQAPWTLPSVVSLLSGYYPHKHGAGLGGKENLSLYSDYKKIQMPSKNIPFLQEILQQSSYQTWGYSTNFWINNKNIDGIGNRSFDEFKVEEKATATKVVNYGIDKIRLAKENGKPFFLYLHFMDAHMPLVPPRKYYNFFPTEDGLQNKKIHEKWEPPMYKDGYGAIFNYREHMISLYDGAIRYMDTEICRLVNELKISGQMKNTVIVILSDHGEEFLDHADFEFAHYRSIPYKSHGTEHGHSMFQELLRVALIITNLDPKGKLNIFKLKQKEIKEFVQLVDLVPTLLEYLELPPFSDCDGNSLLPLLFRWRLPFSKSNGTSAHKSILSASPCRGNSKLSLIEPPYKFIYSYKEIDALFNLHEDPLERKNLICEKQELASNMLDKILNVFTEKPPPTIKVLLNKDELEALKSLGYIDTGVETPKVESEKTHVLNIEAEGYQELTKVYEKYGFPKEAIRLYEYCRKIYDDGDGIPYGVPGYNPCSGGEVENCDDNCPENYNPDQADTDSDGVGDVCDNCPDIRNSNQNDSDDDGIGYFCDNCPNDYNPGQEDRYPPQGNDIGDACDCEGDFNCDGNVDQVDTYLIARAFEDRGALSPPCTNENQCNGDFDCDGYVDVNDIEIFSADFGRGENNNPCPPCEVGDWCVY